MAVRQQRTCPTHGRVLAVRNSEALSIGLTILTFGLWLPIWLLRSLFNPYRCPRCGVSCGWF
jgi:hypothetical protein